MKNHHSGWRWLFLLATLEAGAAFLILALIPRESAGYSAARLLLMLGLGAGAILSLLLAWRTPRTLDRLVSPAGILFSAVAALSFAFTLFLLRYAEPQSLAAVYERLSIVLWYGLALAAELAIFLLVARYGTHPESLRSGGGLLRPAIVAFAILLFVAALVATTRLGLTQDSAYWGEPGVPLMGWQFVLALLAGLAVLVVGLKLHGGNRFDLCIGGILWLTAVLVWLSVPVGVMRNSFYAPMNPPSFQPFPNSDAGYYDSMAESLLIGYPYQGEIPTRPLYITLLALAHLVVGERYDLIIVLQTLILGAIPVLAYLLGRSLHSPAAGVTIALMAVFRELTTLLVSSQTRVSNTKTLLVDLPTLLLLLAACLLVVRWLQRRDVRSAAVAGGVYGLLLLLRTQAAVIAPLIILVALPCYGIRSRKWLVPVAAFVGAGALTVMPWLLHNFLESGHFAFDAPFQYGIIASQYRYTGNLDIQSVDLQGKSLAGIMLFFALRDPRFVFGFITNHFLATLVDGVLALPLIEPFAGLHAAVNTYWLDWSGELSWFNLLLVVGYLALISVGVGAAWRRFRWAGLVPLAFSLGYSLANGLARFSGWRYDLPADWIWYFYAGIGAAEIFGRLALLFGASADRVFVQADPYLAPPPRSAAPVFPILGLLLVGSLPWLAAALGSPRYAGQTEASLAGRLSSASTVQQLGVDADQIQAFLESPDTTIQIGRLLYPRFFTRNEGLASTHPWPAYAPRDFPRLGFVLLNQTRHDMVLPARQPPAALQHGADAIVLGCEGPGYIEARLVLVPDTDVAVLTMPLDTPCP